MTSDIIMVKDHSDSKRNRLFFSIRKGSSISTIPQTGLYISLPLLDNCGALAGTRNNSSDPA